MDVRVAACSNALPICYCLLNCAHLPPNAISAQITSRTTAPKPKKKKKPKVKKSKSADAIAEGAWFACWKEEILAQSCRVHWVFRGKKKTCPKMKISPVSSKQLPVSLSQSAGGSTRKLRGNHGLSPATSQKPKSRRRRRNLPSRNPWASVFSDQPWVAVRRRFFLWNSAA